MKLATHRTTTVPRKGPTIVQKYKMKLDNIARRAAIRAHKKAADDATRDHLGITRDQYRESFQHYFSCDKIAFEDLKVRRLAQALQGPKPPAPGDFIVVSPEKRLGLWGAIKAAFFNPYP